MSYVEKYTVSKRGQEVGPYTATEVIDLLRMKELSTIHKVKVGKDWLLISDFVDLFEKGELPEQNLEKTFEDVEEQAKEAQTDDSSEVEDIPEPEPEPEPEPIEVPSPGAATEIHVNRSGAQFGPYLFKELKDYLKAGNLRFSDMVWFEGVSVLRRRRLQNRLRLPPLRWLLLPCNKPRRPNLRQNHSRIAMRLPTKRIRNPMTPMTNQWLL